jgi:regulatory protein
MKVLKFQKNKIYLEDEIIDVNREIKSKYGIKEGRELSLEEYKSIIYDSALSKSYFLLSRRDYGVRELLEKLQQKYKRSSIVKEILESVVERLKNIGYLDDLSYVKSFIKGKENLGKRRIEYQLHLKGIDQDIINAAYESLKDEINEKDEIKKLFYKVKKKDKDKQIAYFIRRGFNYSDILEVLKELE